MHIRPFEIALIGIFAIAGFAGLMCLKLCNVGGGEVNPFGNAVVIWGTLDGKRMEGILADISEENDAFGVVSYVEMDERTFEDDLVNAIAEGRSPDLVIISHKDLVSYRPKLQPISYESFPKRTFQDTYIDGAEIFMLSDGVYGLPFAADPLVMYWNRDIFSSSGLAKPPETWESIVTDVAKALIRKNDDLEITQSAVAFGEYTNVLHAKEILSMLFLQAGSNVVEEESGRYTVTIGKSTENSLSAGDAAVTFYTQFTQPSKELYSWNRSKKLDRTEFLEGTLALYFGLGSERGALLRENANLNFDIAPVPQGSGVTIKRNYADFYAFAIPRASQNMQGAYAVAQALGGSANAPRIAAAYDFAPVHRSLFANAQTDPFTAIIYQTALVSRGWLDPSPRESADIFKRMVEEIAVGRARVKSVIIDAVHGLESLF